MASKDTGFHLTDPDWTRGRAIALADADAIARRQYRLLVSGQTLGWRND